MKDQNFFFYNSTAKSVITHYAVFYMENVGVNQLDVIVLVEDGGLGVFFSIKHNPADGTNAIAGFKMASQFYKTTTSYSYRELITSNIIHLKAMLGIVCINPSIYVSFQ